MAKIRILPTEIVNRIAAGEVIERPASVVKELIENALDAGSDEIKIEVEEGGKRAIRVRDNGCGIDEESLRFVFTPHATSKITSDEDLYVHKSFGFRGEALASIASIAQVTLSTSQDGQNSGNQVRAVPGEQFVITPCPPVNGTIVEVKNLFLNVPVRRKFLKSDRVEWEQVYECVRRFAISRPDIKLELKGDGKTELLLSRTDIPGRLKEIFGEEINSAFIKIDRESGPYAVTAYCARPRVSRISMDHQFIFVNGKYIRDRLIARALNESYRDVLVSGRYPIAILFIRVHESLVDFNVHPTKIEVRFRNPWELYDYILNSVRESLLKSELTGTVSIPQNYTIKYEPVQKMHYVSTPLPQPVQQYPKDIPEMPRPFQVHNKFIICEVEDGILIIDQHALHERVLLEKLKRQFSSEGTSKQLLLMPFATKVTPEQRRILEENSRLLSAVGLDFDDLAQDTVVIRSMPGVLRNANPTEFVHDFLELSGKGIIQIEDLLELMACKAAVKFGDKLSNEEISSLISQREILDNPHSCAHGRPVAVKIELDKLEGYFMRR